MPTHVKPWCRHFPHAEYDWGHRCDAPIVLLGEAPGRVEDETGLPFVGPSGYDWETWLKAAGLSRDLFYIDNCYPYRPPNNKLGAIDRAELAAATEQAVRRIRAMHPVVVVPTGNTALHALFPAAHMQISDWRGSILNWEGRKCIPTFHPAVTQRQKVLTKLCVADWARIAAEGRFRELRLPQRRHVIDPSLLELAEFDAALQQYFEPSTYTTGTPPRVLSIDVENNHKAEDRHLTCVGFSFDPAWSITVPLVARDYHGDEARRLAAETYVTSWLGREYTVVGQNYQTDLWKLSRRWPGLRSAMTRNYVWDLMEMAHCLDPNDGGDTSEGAEDATDEGLRVGLLDLATLTSLYTREPFYKWMSSAQRWEERQKYNGLDACVQREIFDALWIELFRRGMV